MRLKKIEGFDGYYISDDGRVFSEMSGGFKKLFISREGYYRASLWKKGRGKNVSVHRLVALAFIPNPHNYPMINHIDGNKLNNNVSNLEWCTASMNGKHAFKMGLSHPKTTRIRQLTADGVFIREWDSIKAACDAYGLNHANIATICGGKTNRKQTGGFRWEYAK